MDVTDFEKKELFEKTDVKIAVNKLTLPAVLSSVATLIYSLTDIYFVGYLNDPVQSSAISFVSSVTLAYYFIINLFGLGSSSLVSRFLGKYEYENAKKATATGFYLSLVSSALMVALCSLFKEPLVTLLGADDSTREVTLEYFKWTVIYGCIPSIMASVFSYYIKAEGETKQAGIGITLGCVANIILDPIMILPRFCGHKAAGAGMATLIGNVISLIYFILFLVKKRNKTFVSVDIRNISVYDKHLMKEICNVGFPAAIQNLLNVISMVVVNNIAAAYGPIVVTAASLCRRINSIPEQISIGFNSGLVPLLGYNYTNKNKKRMQDAINYASRVSMTGLMLFALVYFVFSKETIHLFMTEENVVEYGKIFLKGYALGMPFYRMDFLSVNTLQSAGKGRATFYMALIRKIALEIPLMIILNLIVPIYGFAFSQMITEIIMSIIGKKQINKLIKEMEGN